MLTGKVVKLGLGRRSVAEWRPVALGVGRFSQSVKGMSRILGVGPMLKSCDSGWLK